MWYLRILEFIGLTILGDGVACVVAPRRHMLLWRDALPARSWRNLFQWFADRSEVTIATGLIECLIGLVLLRRAIRDR